MNAVTMYNDVKDFDITGTMWYALGTINDNKYAIVFTQDEEGKRGKVAYQSVNSIMQCDYDIDWLMPYNEATGEVDDTDISIDTIEDVRWLIEQAERIVKEATR